MGLEIGLALALVASAFVYLRHTVSRKRVPLPPGPPADPLIGHLRLIPSEGQDLFFYELGKTYGDVIQLKVLGQSLIILNSVEAATDLLDKRSSIYSDRPQLPIYDLMGIGDCLGLMRYGKAFRFQRRIVQQYFNNNKRQEHRPIQIRGARISAIEVLSDPEDWHNLLLRFAATVIVETGYGHQISSAKDPFFTMAQECCEIAANSGPAGATPVDLFPILRHFPSWFPGTYYAHFAQKSFSAFQRLREYPFSQVTDQMANGTARPSFLLTQLESLRNKGDQDDASVKWVQAASMFLYIAGTETTSSSLAFFVLAMVLHPECQARAQAEIEAVIGAERLPEFHDREKLPYVECLVQETLRWNQPAPTAGPHRLMEDDVYRGMFIPAGSLVIPNVRAMTLNDDVYKDPFRFDPTRYLPAPAGRGEPFSTAHFGFGRRICPGRYLAEDSLWIVITTMLATSTFLKPLGNDGKEIIPDATPVTSGIVTHPRPFNCRIEPRTKAAMELLKQSVEH